MNWGWVLAADRGRDGNGLQELPFVARVVKASIAWDPEAGTGRTDVRGFAAKGRVFSRELPKRQFPWSFLSTSLPTPTFPGAITQESHMPEGCRSRQKRHIGHSAGAPQGALSLRILIGRRRPCSGSECPMRRRPARSCQRRRGLAVERFQTSPQAFAGLIWSGLYRIPNGTVRAGSVPSNRKKL